MGLQIIAMSFSVSTVFLLASVTWYLPDQNGDCDSIPPQVNSGTPDICALSNAGEDRCICIKLDGYGVYLPHCGKCVDPCALKFVPSKRFPRRKNAKLTEAEEAFLKELEK